MSVANPCFLLTDANGRSVRGVQIRAGRAIQSRHGGADMISHNIWECASSPQLAVMINPLHATSVHPRLFEIHHNEVALVPGRAVVNLRIRELQVPTISAAHKLAFAILTVRGLDPAHSFYGWGDRWLSGFDRTTIAARLALAALKPRRQSGADAAPESEFQRRAREVVTAALLWQRQPKQWQQHLAEHVAIAVSGLPDSPAMRDFANLALDVIEERGEPKTPEYEPPRYRLFRQQEAQSPRPGGAKVLPFTREHGSRSGRPTRSDGKRR